MSDPAGPEDLARRLHAAIHALDPDAGISLPDQPGPTDAANLLGRLMAMGDYWASTMPDPGRDTMAEAYTRTDYPTTTDVPEPADIHRILSVRLELTARAAAVRAGEGAALVIGGACNAAQAAAHMLVVLRSATAEHDPAEPVHPETLDRMNGLLLSAQEQFDFVQAGFAKLAAPFGGMPRPDELHSDDPRITSIVDWGTSVRVEYSFDTPDGPLSLNGSAPLTDRVDLVGLTAEERHTALVRMVEASVDETEQQALRRGDS